MSCPVCKHPDTHLVMQSYDDRYGYYGLFSLRRCPNCGHAFLVCNLTPNQLTELYTNFYPRKTFDVAKYKPHKERTGLYALFDGFNSSAFRWVPENVRVLDVGCGFGESLGYHTARGCDVYGVEADENIRRVAEKFGYKVHVGLFDDKLYKADFFDYVTMDQVIEHVTDPLSTLRGVARILKSGGSAILSTPNANGWGAKNFWTALDQLAYALSFAIFFPELDATCCGASWHGGGGSPNNYECRMAPLPMATFTYVPQAKCAFTLLVAKQGGDYIAAKGGYKVVVVNPQIEG